jgi:hypothetical protein
VERGARSGGAAALDAAPAALVGRTTREAATSLLGVGRRGRRRRCSGQDDVAAAWRSGLDEDVARGSRGRRVLSGEDGGGAVLRGPGPRGGRRREGGACGPRGGGAQGRGRQRGGAVLRAGDDDAAALRGGTTMAINGGGCGSRNWLSVGRTQGRGDAGIYRMGAFGPGSSFGGPRRKCTCGPPLVPGGSNNRDK